VSYNISANDVTPEVSQTQYLSLYTIYNENKKHCGTDDEGNRSCIRWIKNIAFYNI